MTRRPGPHARLHAAARIRLRKQPSGAGSDADVALRALIRKDTGTMATSIFAAAESTTLPFSPEVFGIGTIVVFALLLVATLAFRNAGNRH
jgi:hypothetical protein